MKSLSRLVLISLFVVFMLTACIVPSRHGGVDVLLPPPLPMVIDLGPDRYYHQNGYNYYYQGDRWQYSKDRDGSRSDLPRSHWPREIRQRGDRR